MSDASLTGSCFCGAIRFAIELPAGACVHCHCSMCRRMHGAAYVTWVEVPRDRFRVESGAERLHTFDSSGHGKRSFCTGCGSALFCELAERPDHIDVVIANLDGDVDLAPQAHIFFDDRASWTKVGDDLPRLGGASGVEPRNG